MSRAIVSTVRPLVVQSGLDVGGNHRYHLGGVEAHSVSRMIKACGYGSPIDVPEDLQEAIFDRGRRFHATIDAVLIDHGVNIVDVDDDNAEQFERANQWIERHDVQYCAVEFPMAARSPYGYVVGGRVDAIARVGRVELLQRTIIDWKRGEVTAANMIQMAAYVWLAQECGYGDIRDGIVVGCGEPDEDEAVAYRPTAAARLAWSSIMRGYLANERPIHEWATRVP